MFGRLRNLGGFIKDAIKAWWNGDSSLGDTLKNIGKKLKDTIAEWWETSSIKKLWNEKIQPKLESLKQRLGKVNWEIPKLLGGGKLWPFGPLVGKPFFEGGKIAETIDKAKTAITGVDEKTLAIN